MMRLVDADDITYWAGTVDRNGEWLTRKKTIDELPTIDAVPVVRCEDCKHGLEKSGGLVRCDVFGWMIRDFFCGLGGGEDNE